MKLNNVLDELSRVFATRWASAGAGHRGGATPDPRPLILAPLLTSCVSCGESLNLSEP